MQRVPGWLAMLDAPYRVIGGDAIRAACHTTARRMLDALDAPAGSAPHCGG